MIIINCSDIYRHMRFTLADIIEEKARFRDASNLFPPGKE
jgi:hypothetical protein